MHRPFDKLDQPAGRPAGPHRAMGEKIEPPAVDLPEDLDEEELFEWAMRDVVPLPGERTDIDLPVRPDGDNGPDEESEALRELESLVEGTAPFDFTSSDEYIERAVAPGARPLLRKLRRGQYAVQAVLDLHGMDREEARRSVEAFLLRAVALRKGCVKIIHGRGRNSKENRAVLKGLLQQWLATRRMSRTVLAYTSARPCDGGAGAVYVLVRRPRP